MKTPDEIKKGLELHANVDESCFGKGCPFAGGEEGAYCIDVLARDALALIQQLEAKLAEYEKPLVPLTLEEAKKRVGVWIEDDGCCWGDDDPHPVLYHARVNCHWLAFMDEAFEKDGDEYRYFVEAEYSITWRCWERKPTEEERRAAKWND